MAGGQGGPLGTLLGDHDNRLGGDLDGTNGSRSLESWMSERVEFLGSTRVRPLWPLPGPHGS